MNNAFLCHFYVHFIFLPIDAFVLKYMVFFDIILGIEII